MTAETTYDWSFLHRPRWILSHLLVLSLIVLMFLLGLWQLDRLDEKRTLNDRITARSEEDPVPVSDLLGSDPADVEYRAVTAEGVYAVGSEVRVSNQTLEGVPGDWVISVLELDDGGAVAVNRGFIPRAQIPDVGSYAAPTGEVTVDGWLLETQSGGSIGTPEAALADAPPEMNRVDLDLIGDLVGVELGEMWIQLGSSTSERSDGAPTPVPLPDPGEGSHFAYAVQWFLFTAIAVGGYPLVLRRIARADERRGDTAPGPS